ncbi:uncharacterized protein (DUF2336 family) [Rhodopseudomonas rhenobacensis]|uniref:Uncharacterized protein (DUF2336 family) n=1 Tax=Rhodopseudomonas rhenobacensis TaxID=87461 RepID=A0A7W7Z4A9_9BRAD|nr:DUF2336 domain-containing protein [Rhodopseudomonas rhenobacensis]MBB5047768.1 uncharacterized protein (DUF2336 family) [Rhodopseudomonas rhenobacensis]
MMLKAKAASENLLDELQDTLTHGPVARRVETLRRVTDLFINGAVDYSDDQVALFDDVFACLVRHIEAKARALLAQRLAPIVKAPPRIIRHLASDDLIEVAAPVLTQSTQLDDRALIATARSKSQGHMLAISKRQVLSGAVTEVLVELGNTEVVHSTVNNPGAEFSEQGYSTLAWRVESDDNLSALVGMVSSIPRHHYLKLIAKASVSVRSRLQAAHPQEAGEVASAVREASRRARLAPAAMSRETVIAHGLVRALHEDGRLNEHLLGGFAEEGKFDETNAALACMANVTVSVAESMMIESRAEGVLILAKVAGLSWTTVCAIINLRNELAGMKRSDLDAFRLTYEQLRPTTAQQVLRFHRMQQETAQAAARDDSSSTG